MPTCTLSRTGPLKQAAFASSQLASGVGAWLASLGDPYRATLIDADGRVGIDYGVYGVPETFLVDRRGVVRYKHVGPVTQQVWDDTLAPLIEHLRAEAANKSKGEGG